MNMNNKNIIQKPNFAILDLIPSFTKNNYGWFFSGFSHADGSFMISFIFTKTSLSIQFKFVVALGISSLALLKEFQKFFGCGTIRVTENSCFYYVTSLQEIWHILLPHFIKFPMHGSKFLSFKTFVYCMALYYPYTYKNKPLDVVLEIINSSFFMNAGSRRSLLDYNKLLAEIGKIYGIDILNLNLVPYNPVNLEVVVWKPLYVSLQNFITNTYNISLDFIKGVLEGDGSFIIKFNQKMIYTFICTITTNIQDIGLLYTIKIRLGCGYIYISPTKTYCRYEINKIEDLNNIIIPLIDSLELYRGTNNNLLCSKSITYAIWKEGIQKHVNNEISRAKSIRVKTAANQIQREATINFIKNAYHVFEGGRQRKLNLNEFLKQQNLDN